MLSTQCLFKWGDLWGDLCPHQCEVQLYLLRWSHWLAVRKTKVSSTNGVKISGKYTVYRNQNELFEVHCDFDSEADFVWPLVQSFSLQNAAQFANKIFGVNFLVNENGGTIIWGAYHLSLSHMRSIAEVSTHLRATCNFPDDGLMYTDYVRAKLQGQDLFGAWKAQCRMCELVIRGLNCCDCTAGTWQKAGQSWHINSYLSAEKGWRFNGTKGAVNYEQNFGRYLMANPSFRCTSNQNATTQHWIGSKLSN